MLIVMITRANPQSRDTITPTFIPGLGFLQRKCACGSHTPSLAGECADCNSEKQIQAKLTVGASNDPLEQEADRIADQVSAAPAHGRVTGATPHIQRFAGQPTGQGDAAPGSVDRVLSTLGSPLDPALRQDMERRFGYDFSRVRVHSGVAAEQSAKEVQASAYTVGHNVVFGAGRFALNTHAGRCLIAHELTHVVQQSGAQMLQRKADVNAKDNEPTGFAAIDSQSGTLTLDAFASDSSELVPAQHNEITRYKARIAKLLKQYPDSFISVVGHTDATHTEQHNSELGQHRADVVMAALGDGELGIPMSIMRAYSLGKTQLKVQTQDREPRNRRVEVLFSARSFGFRKQPPFTATPELPKMPGYKLPDRPPPIPTPGPDPKPGWFRPIPPAPKGAEPKSVLDLINETIVDPVVKAATKWLPEKFQKEIVDLAHTAVEKGVISGLEEALHDSRLNEKDRENIKKAVENAIKLKDKPFDPQGDKEGSPHHHREIPPSAVPPKPDDSQWK